jgi:hypothetical protein
MMRTFGFILAASVGFIVADPRPVRSDEAGQAQRLLDKSREDPAYYARLKRELQTFLALPPERQERMRHLDRALREEDSANSVRLLRVMERYAEWLRRLPEEDRKRIEAAADAKDRIQIIKQFREREWIEHLPKAARQELAKLSPDEQRTRIAELREEERTFRDSWRTAMRQWDEIMRERPQVAALQQLAPQVQNFVQEFLWPALSPIEKERLGRARNQQQLFLETLVELADKYPLRFPGPRSGPTRFNELPLEVQQQLPGLKLKAPPRVVQLEGKWPDYCMAITAVAKQRKGGPVRQLGPSRPAEFTPSVQAFIEKKLIPRLSSEEKKRLQDAEGRWPEYPQVVLNLARHYGLHVPGMALPGPPQLWQSFRKRTAAADVEVLPGVSDKTLLDFMRNDMSAEERESLPSLSISDPVTVARLKQLYFRKNPAELNRLRQQDLKKQTKGGR